ncbi:uncharacterized protein LOC132202692 [Neocloeon triangulifer]|uniref:uncharacterized protein LOC132202692 n=1 Tax=Neocloeon triangulifer TaxID=2078957 RepID=UPI00286EFCF3|nr:uncharacterized protein LOC132202692 [Neocloeon triangulifer]
MIVFGIIAFAMVMVAAVVLFADGISPENDGANNRVIIILVVVAACIICFFAVALSCLQSAKKRAIAELGENPNVLRQQQTQNRSRRRHEKTTGGNMSMDSPPPYDSLFDVSNGFNFRSSVLDTPSIGTCTVSIYADNNCTPTSDSSSPSGDSGGCACSSTQD